MLVRDADIHTVRHYAASRRRIQQQQLRVDSGRRRNCTLRGEVPVECAIDAPLADTAVSANVLLLDLPSEGQHHRVGELDLLVTIVICWNTFHPGETVRPRKHASLTVGLELLAHISPLGWAYILLTGEYWWPKRRWRPRLAMLPPTGATSRSSLAHGPARIAATRACASLELRQPTARLR